jgi:hypothetical protein
MVISFLFMWTKMITIRFIVQNKIVPKIGNVPQKPESDECCVCPRDVLSASNSSSPE